MQSKLKIVSIFLVLVLLFNIFAPTMSVIATGYGEGNHGIRLGIGENQENFTIQQITVDGNNYDNNADEYFSNDGIHTAIITVQDKADKYPDIGWGGNWNGEDGTITKASSHENGVYTYTLTINCQADSVKYISLMINPKNKVVNNAEIEFHNATSITGTATTMNVNYTNGKIVVTGANMTSGVNANHKQYISTTSTGNMTFEAVANQGYTARILENGVEKVNPYILNIQANGHYNVDAEFIKQNNPSNPGDPTIIVTAGAGTYGPNQTPYDAGTEEDYINVSITDTQATTVTFAFATLWIGRFYENIVINGVSYNVSDYIDFDDRTEWLTANHGTQLVNFEIQNVAKANEYNVVVKHGENIGRKYLATFLWTADPAQANGHNYIGNAKLEFVKAVYSVGDTEYTVTEEALEGRLQRDGEFMNANSQDGFLSYGYTADVNFDDGSLTLPGGAEVTMRVVPEYGYQVTSVNGGNDFRTTDAGVSEFTVTVPEGTAGYFQATVEKVNNTVTPTSEKVKAGEIKLGDNAATDIKNGTVRLSVEDVELSSDKISNFQEKANEAGEYKISNYLDINLDKVLYKGSSEDVWSEQIHHLTDKALITLQLEEGVDASNIVIVHNIDNGDEFEIIQIESYDPVTNTITFYTDSFSNYAIATKTKDTTKNPSTGDTIMRTFSVLAISTFGLMLTVKVNKNRRIRKH